MIQTEISNNNIIKILKKVDLYINQCVEDNVKLICLPELFATQINIMDLYSVSEPIGGTICSFLCERAKKYNVFIVAGILEKDGYEVFNSAVLINTKGEIIGVHRKIYLNNFEKGFLSCGSKSEVFETELGKIGIVIGSDISSFNVCQKLAENEVELIICLIQSPADMSVSIECIVKSRALDIEAFIVVVSNVGFSKLADMNFKGISRVLCNPVLLGQDQLNYDNKDSIIIKKTQNKEMIITCECDIEKLNEEKIFSYSPNKQKVIIE